MSGEIINLNKARKARDKAAKDAKAAQNRASFGRTTGEKAKAMSIAQKARQMLDDAKRDRDPK
jgi:hypothetical protein